ncbi:hypothetical protein FD19_GL001561 [Lacticaseibacillus thailandensis DSM 22698 = JCM 13996]|uniref:NIF system FeS cluster assembly NifU N-terminal domain-containing protein n=1 Tax=Lacticaseibacillus thailandensis DSM 22698 = JCM 13996 TaxID=1423810 RepID=A0A0R2CAE6_9LACO|nr:hypothetical protein FD19_GL001561 [Lacticaseibacillus thailandensis DSM 22698 = JCM 13996]
MQQLYRQVLLDAAAHPRHAVALAHPQATVAAKNPTCGDTLTLALTTDGQRVTGISAQAAGCTISRASASMMTTVVADAPLTTVHQLSAAFQAMVVDGQPAPRSLGDAAALASVHDFPARVKCALLAWTTLDAALRQLPGAKGDDKDATDEEHQE